MAKGHGEASTAPMCRLCQHRHWQREPHIFDGPAKPLARVDEDEAPLEETDRLRYLDLKALVSEHWAVVGAALQEIRDRRLWRDEFDSFDAFCTEVLGFGERNASHLITGASIVQQLRQGNEDFGTTQTPVVPKNAGTARALAPLKDDPPALREAWAETVERVGPGATSRDVRDTLAPPPPPVVEEPDVEPPLVEATPIPSPPNNDAKIASPPEPQLPQIASAPEPGYVRVAQGVQRVATELERTLVLVRDVTALGHSQRAKLRKDLYDVERALNRLIDLVG